MAEVKKSGKVYDDVTKLLKLRGIDTQKLGIFTFPWRGVEHLVIIDDETIGEYNHKSKKLLLYEDMFKR